MQPLPSSDSSKSFAMAPAAGHRRFCLPSVLPTRALFTGALRFLQLHFRLLILLFFPSLYLLLHLSATFSLDSNTFLTDFLPVLAFSSGLVLFLRHILPCFRVFPRLPKFLPSIREFSFWSDAGRRTGLAVQPYNNGDIYEGELRRGKCYGNGVYYYYRSGMYEGEWIDSKYDGHGVETLTNGSKYRGQFEKGLRHGYGVYRYHTGDLYAGEWVNGKSHGYGVHTCEDGSWYVGEFNRGLKHGSGHSRFRNGDTYAGEYFADKMHGFGTYRFADGQCHEGAWREGKREGLGMCSSAKGESQSGRWANGVLEISTSRNPFPGASFAVNHTRVLDAVQDARTAAENAYNVPRVDDRVSKAVAAADNAAKAAAIAGSKAVQTVKRDRGVEYVHDFPMQMV